MKISATRGNIQMTAKEAREFALNILRNLTVDEHSTNTEYDYQYDSTCNQHDEKTLTLECASGTVTFSK